MKSMVAINENNASVVEFDGNAIPPLLLPSSTDDGCCFLCESIEHIIIYLSGLTIPIHFSNTVPCNFLQIDVLYQVPTVIQYGLFISISYYSC